MAAQIRSQSDYYSNYQEQFFNETTGLPHSYLSDNYRFSFRKQFDNENETFRSFSEASVADSYIFRKSVPEGHMFQINQG